MNFSINDLMNKVYDSSAYKKVVDLTNYGLTVYNEPLMNHRWKTQFPIIPIINYDDMEDPSISKNGNKSNSTDPSVQPRNDPLKGLNKAINITKNFLSDALDFTKQNILQIGNGETITYDGTSLHSFTFPLLSIESNSVKNGLKTFKVAKGKKLTDTMTMRFGLNQYTLVPLEYFQYWTNLAISPNKRFVGLPGTYFKWINLALTNQYAMTRLKVEVCCFPTDLKFGSEFSKTEKAVEPLKLEVTLAISDIRFSIGTDWSNNLGFGF